MKKQKVGVVNFEINGAKMNCYLHEGKLPKQADKSDVIEIEIIPAFGRGTKDSWFLNVYDAQHIIWLLSDACIKVIERDVELAP